MTETKTTKLSIGSQSFDIRPMTVKQLEQIETVLTSGNRSSIGLAKGVIKAALSRDHSAVDVEELEMTGDQIKDAMENVIKLSGFGVAVEPAAAA